MALFNNKTQFIGFATTLVALCVIGALSYRNIQQLSDHDRWVAHTHEVLAELEGLQSVVKDAMIGQRGYLITGDEKFLAPYHSARDVIKGRETKLAGIVSDSPVQTANVKLLRAKIDKVFELLEANLQTYAKGGFNPAQEVVRSGRSTDAMGEVRAMVATMEQIEEKLLDERTTIAQEGYDRAVDMFLVSTTLGVAMVVAAFELLRRDLRNREAAADAVRQARDSLEVRVQERTAELGNTNRALESEIGQRRQAQEKLEVFAEQLQRSNRELQEFASIASHDLQEPLRKIQAFGDRLQSLSGSQMGAEGLDYLTRMQHAAARMRKLIDDLLAFSRLTTRAQVAVPVDLNVVAREVLEDLEGRLAQTGGRVEVATLPVVEADASQMRQLLQNLIGNALKFRRPEEPPLVKVEAEVIPDPLIAEQKLCRLTVSDNCIGFDEKYLDRIFNVFQRLHTRNEYEGTGMGLAIVRKIALYHDGDITAKSKPGQGSTFILTVPVVHNKEARYETEKTNQESPP